VQILSYCDYQWEERSSRVEIPSYTFPDDDLLHSLIDLYFDQINLFLPLLHRPTFNRSITTGQHLTDSGFGAIVLLVCALGSRYSEDKRVLLDDISTYHSAGWKWFDQVQLVKMSFVIPSTLYDVQFCCVNTFNNHTRDTCIDNWAQLAVQYLRDCTSSHQCWAMIGIGVRMAQDVGAHRRKYKLDKMTVEDEMWKRAFWYVLFLSPGCLYIMILPQGLALLGSCNQLFAWTPLCYSG
jgi:Fungal specific transcription factor domain